PPPAGDHNTTPFPPRPWAGRKARCRGHARILTDILTRASAINLARLATLGLHQAAGGGPIANPDPPPPAAPAPTNSTAQHNPPSGPQTAPATQSSESTTSAAS